ncbi:MAG: glycoside hydrolase family 9 protein [Oscillospiraceae bacterium]|nr:glycoside hydrolase family 9 protein [Oscillospiraceae bacterium]
MDKTYFTRKMPQLRAFDKDVFVNQTGYHKNRRKIAVIKSECTQFYVKDECGDIKYKSEVSHFGIDTDSQDDVYIADFSLLCCEGTFYIETDTKKRSVKFEISDSCCDKVFDDVCKAFYFLRCGTELKAEHAGKYSHPVCHCASAVEWSDRDIMLDVSGGWHDAGDYGRYVTAGACALAHILFAYRLFPEAFKSQKLNIPESNNSMPDMLCECRYELDWLLKMQKSDGGVYHKATTSHHAPFIMPQDDLGQMYVFDVSSMATADFAAICALASRIYAEYDKKYSQKLLRASVKSYQWLEQNPDFIGFENPKGCNTGCYGERDDFDNRFWAASELFCTTGDEKYHTDMKNSLQQHSFPVFALGYGCTSGLGAFSYIFDAKNPDIDILQSFRKEFVVAAERFAALADKCGYGAAMETRDWCWGSNMNIGKRAMIFIIADKIENKNRFSDYACAQLDFLLGVNATGYSFVTQNGEFSSNYPHLRPAHADGIDECIPGMVCGGPNRFPADPDAKLLIRPSTPPMKCYADDVGCYSLNEITIYWNSPVVFLCAYIKEKYKN